MAGLLPGVALLAWAWRIGSHRGLGSVAGRLAALLAAMPVLAAVLAASVPHAVAWPTVARARAAPSALAGRGAALGRAAACWDRSAWWRRGWAAPRWRWG